MPRKAVKTSLDKRAKLAKGVLKNAEESGKTVVDDDGKTIAKDIHIPLPFIDPSMVEINTTASSEGEEQEFVEFGNSSEEGSNKKVKRRERGAAFIPLEDVLPPLPQRGSFDVNEIKVSCFFFSSSRCHYQND